jgi:hypothetical protein
MSLMARSESIWAVSAASVRASPEFQRHAKKLNHTFVPFAVSREPPKAVHGTVHSPECPRHALKLNHTFVPYAVSREPPKAVHGTVLRPNARGTR